MNRSPDAARRNPGTPSPHSAPLHAGYTLRRYEPRDEDASVALWLRTWEKTYPELDFAERLDWWRERWRNELLPAAEVVVAEADGAMIGFVTVDPRTLYLDQIVVAPERWRSSVGSALLAEAKRISPSGLDLHVNIDNARAIAFYVKHGFAISGADENPITGRPVHRMSWQP
jgi:putative acetyltransferase